MKCRTFNTEALTKKNTEEFGKIAYPSTIFLIYPKPTLPKKNKKMSYYPKPTLPKNELLSLANFAKRMSQVISLP